jgi:hypothetical protein
MMADHPKRSLDQAEYLAIQVLTFLAEDELRLERFLQLTGITPGALRDGVREPAILAALLDHLLSDESLLLTFAANSGTDPADIARARRILERDGCGN